MNENQIEHRCKCGRCFIERGRWRILLGPLGGVQRYADQYCPYCGYHLGDDGFAYEMVQKNNLVEWLREQESVERGAEQRQGHLSDHVGAHARAANARTYRRVSDHIQQDPSDKGANDERESD